MPHPHCKKVADRSDLLVLLERLRFASSLHFRDLHHLYSECLLLEKNMESLEFFVPEEIMDLFWNLRKFLENFLFDNFILNSELCV